MLAQPAAPIAPASQPAVDTAAPEHSPQSAPTTAPAAEAEAEAGAKAEANPASPAPPATTSEPPAKPAPSLEESDQLVERAARGSVEACESVTFPLTMIPGAGDVVGSVVEWACLVPGVFGADYAEAHHGQRDALLWQPAIALVASKLFADVLMYPAIAAGVFIGIAYATMAIPALIVAPYFIPVGIAGLLSLGGGVYVLYKKVKKRGEEWVFETVYHLLAWEAPEPARRAEIQERALVKPPLEGVGWAWALMATAGGAEPEWELAQWIPVAGPIIKAGARGEAIKAAMRHTASEVLHEQRTDFAAVDTTTDVLTGAEGLLGASGHALLIAGGVLAFAGTIAAGLQYQDNQNLGTYAAVAGSTGGVGIAVAATGIGLIALREVPRGLIPIAIPMVYGFGGEE